MQPPFAIRTARCGACVPNSLDLLQPFLRLPFFDCIKLKPADAIASEMVDAILGDLSDEVNGEALLFANGFGATPAMELYVVYHAARRLLEAAGVSVDSELLRLWDAPVHTAALRAGF